MKDLFHAALSIQTFFQSKGWSFCFIGGIALQRWGEPRLTLDIDVSLLTDFKDAALYIDQILHHFPPRIPDTRSFALNHRVLLVKTADQIAVDISLAGIPFEEQIIRRASMYEFDNDLALLTCGAEDLIVMKAFANRDKDWGDVAGIVMRQGHRLEWSSIWRDLKPLSELKEDPEILTHLQRIMNEEAQGGDDTHSL
jgi:hypothetical protein